MGSVASSDSSADAALNDLHEYFRAGPALRTGEPEIDRYYPGNRWPVGLPALRTAAGAYNEQMLAAARSMLEVLASSLNLPPDSFATSTNRATRTLGINRYPSLNELGTVAPGQFRIGQHTDFGTITLLNRDRGVGGLQVQERSGHWVDAPYLADAYMMIVGDMLDCWTDGRWPAVRHRVLPPSPVAPDEELFSLLFFFEANPDAVITPMREPRGGGKHWRPMVAGDYLLGRVEDVTLE
jgi:validamycin A dioxygenase